MRRALWPEAGIVCTQLLKLDCLLLPQPKGAFFQDWFKWRIATTKIMLFRWSLHSGFSLFRCKLHCGFIIFDALRNLGAESLGSAVSATKPKTSRPGRNFAFKVTNAARPCWSFSNLGLNLKGRTGASFHSKYSTFCSTNVVT